MEVPVEIHKIIKCTIYSTVLSPSGGGVDDALVRLLLIKQIFRVVKLMWVLFSVKHSQIFWES